MKTGAMSGVVGEVVAAKDSVLGKSDALLSSDSKLGGGGWLLAMVWTRKKKGGLLL